MAVAAEVRCGGWRVGDEACGYGGRRRRAARGPNAEADGTEARLGLGVRHVVARGEAEVASAVLVWRMGGLGDDTARLNQQRGL